MKKNKTVDAFIAKHEKWGKPLELLRKIILSTELKETVKWGMPTYTLSSKNIVGIAAFKNHFGIWFFQGGLLKDKAKKLVNAQEGKTKAMRQWRFTSIDEIDKKLIKQYIEEAIANQKAGKVIKPAKPKKDQHFEIPDLLQTAFLKNKKLIKAFEQLSTGKQKEYANYITEAKREATKLKRVEKIIPLILAGGGLYDKYK